MDYKIIDKPAFKVVGIKEEIPNDENLIAIPQMWDKLSQNPDKVQQILSLADTEITTLLGICGKMDQSSFDYWIGAVSSKAAPAGLEVLEIPAAKWVIFESKGPLPDSIQGLWKRIFTEWLPNSGYEHAPIPDVEWYSDGDIHAADYRSEVWLPIVKSPENKG